MINLKKAIEIAEEYIGRNEQHDLVLLHENTMTFELGWVFFYQARQYVETGDFMMMIDGNAPIIVNKDDGSIHLTGTEARIEKYIRDYIASH